MEMSSSKLQINPETLYKLFECEPSIGNLMKLSMLNKELN